MGCDIHLYLEHKDQGRWVYLAAPARTCRNCGGAGKNQPPGDPDWVGHPCYWCRGTGVTTRSLYRTRNYWLFGILADVRNDGFMPIAPPRGVPEDASHEYADIVERWDDGHSHSYFSARELNDFDWKQLSTSLGTTYAEASGDFYSDTIPALNRLAEQYGGPDNVRILFFFDN